MEFLISAAIGSILGFLAGLGVGGGSLLMLWLTQVKGLDQSDARAINLLFFLPGAAIATALKRKQGTVMLKPLLPAIAAGCTAAALGTWLGKSLDTALLKKLFGGLLIITGIREILYRKK